MPKAKAESVPVKKASVVRARTATVRKAASPAAARKPRPPRRSPVRAVQVEVAAPAEVEAVVSPEALVVAVEAAIEDAQSQVVASKFANVETAAATAPAKTAAKAPRPTLPASYGESHLLLLVRDPQTLFAAWDMAPTTLDALKGRLGRRGLAVSTLTLRLTRVGGATTVVHVGNHARSTYLKIDGGPSFTAEIGFTTPAGRFELVARSAPCFVPMGPLARAEPVESGGRSVLGYREAVGVAQRGGLSSKQASHTTRPHKPARGGADADALSASGSRVLGGASDLYRR